MTSMIATMTQISLAAASSPNVGGTERLVRRIDTIQMALEIAGQDVTASAFIWLSDFVQDGRDGFVELPDVVACAREAAEIEPNSLAAVITTAETLCEAFEDEGSEDLMSDMAILAAAISAWRSITTGPNAAVLHRAECARARVAGLLRDEAFDGLVRRGTMPANDDAPVRDIYADAIAILARRHIELTLADAQDLRPEGASLLAELFGASIARIATDYRTAAVRIHEESNARLRDRA